MEWMEGFARYSLSFLENYSFFYIIFRKNFREMSKRNITGIIIGCMALLTSMLLGFDLEGGMAPFSGLSFIIYAVLYFIFEVSIVEMIGLSLVQWSILSMLEMAVFVGLEYLKVVPFLLDNITMVIISACLWLYYLVIGKRFKRQLFQMPIKMWYLLDIIIFVLTAMMQFFSYVIVERLPKDHVTELGKMFVILGGCLICILLLAMIHYYDRMQNFRLEKELAKTQNEQQREYFQQLLKREEETRRFRHDIINDLVELQHYCERQDYGRLEDYLEDTLGVIKNISKSSYDVGNDIINTVLNYYLQPVKEDCDVEVNGYIGENISVEQRDLCTVSANLVKNAVEAMEKQKYGSIVFTIAMGEQYLLIKVENTFEGDLVLGKDGIPETTKINKKNHGIGLQNIKQVVEKYDGDYNIETKNGRYLTEVFLKV